MKRELILGNNFLVKYDPHINYCKRLVHIAGVDLPMFLTEAEASTKLAENHVPPPSSSSFHDINHYELDDDDAANQEINLPVRIMHTFTTGDK